MKRRKLIGLSILGVALGAISVSSPLAADSAAKNGSEEQRSVDGVRYFAQFKDLSSQRVLAETLTRGRSSTSVESGERKFEIELSPILWRGQVPTLQMEIYELKESDRERVSATGLALEGVTYSDAKAGLQIVLSREDW